MPQAIVISAAKNGHINQCKALCQAMGWQVLDVLTLPGTAAYHPLVKKLSIWYKQPTAIRRIMASLATMPDVPLVFSGQAASRIAARLPPSGKPRIFVGIPKGSKQLYDYAVCFAHEAKPGQFDNHQAFKAAQHTVWMHGVPCTPPASAARKSTLAILLGGGNNAYSFSSDDLVDQINLLKKAGLPLAIAFSRRTPALVEQTLRSRFPGAKLIARDDRQGFLDLVATASHFAITPDSITMICEACATGQPVAVFALPAYNADSSTFRFTADFLRQGYVTPVPGLQAGDDWPAGKPWDETPKVAAELQQAIARHAGPDRR